MIEESIHVTFDKSNLLSIEVDVIDCVSILEKASLEDDGQDKNQVQEADQHLNKDAQVKEANLENKSIPNG